MIDRCDVGYGENNVRWVDLFEICLYLHIKNKIIDSTQLSSTYLTTGNQNTKHGEQEIRLNGMEIIFDRLK